LPAESLSRTKKTARNLRTLCRRHHRLKTTHHWQLRAGLDGAITWTSPAGTSYPQPPQPALP